MKTRKILFLISFLCASVLMQAQVKLSFNPVEGKTYSYRLTSEQSVEQTINEQKIPVNILMDMLTEMNIKKNTEDGISVEYLYAEMVMDMSAPMMSVKFDSKNTAENISESEKLISQFFNGLIGKSMIIVFGTDGSVKSISGLDAILEEIQNNMDSNSPATQQVKNMFSQIFSEDIMKQSIEQSFKIYPEGEVKIGDSWNGDMLLSMAGINYNMKSTYTLKSIENNIALLDVTSVLNTKISEIMEGEISGEQKGEISLDIKTGMPIKSVITQNANGKFTIQGKELLMNMTSKATVSLQK